jgi:hypothetical protein
MSKVFCNEISIKYVCPYLSSDKRTNVEINPNDLFISSYSYEGCYIVTTDIDCDVCNGRHRIYIRED